jgi:hypothetical protein
MTGSSDFWAEGCSMSESWRPLLEIAERHLDSVGLTRDDWVWGGGTMLMLRHKHRLSRDIDLFLSDPQVMTMLSPRLNDAVTAELSDYQESGNHLRLEIGDRGEIDYLLVAPVIDTGSVALEIEGLGTFNAMPEREVLAQKLYYRAAWFKGRDLFDFGFLTRARPELLDDRMLHRAAVSRISALDARLDNDALRAGFEAVQVHPDAPFLPDFAESRDRLRNWLGGGCG